MLLIKFSSERVGNKLVTLSNKNFLYISESHKSVEQVQCAICKKVFTDESKLAKHIQIIHDSDPSDNYECDKEQDQLYQAEIIEPVFKENKEKVEEPLNDESNAKSHEIMKHTSGNLHDFCIHTWVQNVSSQWPVYEVICLFLRF